MKASIASFEKIPTVAFFVLALGISWTHCGRRRRSGTLCPCSSPSSRSCCGSSASRYSSPLLNNTANGLLIPVLLHATVNFSAATLAVLPASEADDARPFLLYTLLVCLLATIVVLLTGPRLSRKPRVRETTKT